MKVISKLVITWLGAALLSNTPAPTYAVSFKVPAVAVRHMGLVVDVRSGRRYKRGQRSYRRQGGNRSSRDHSRHGGYGGYGGYIGFGGYGGIGIGIASGIIIGSIIAESARRSADTLDAHVDWCYRKYRSYRESDDTFQPYNGRRRRCRSPYY